VKAPPARLENEDETHSREGSYKRRDIQGLRAISVLGVVAFHAGLPVPGGFTGVDVFFVISGFVITAMLHREWLEYGRIRFLRFYMRRFKRLTPALALTVTVTVVLAAALLSPLGQLQERAAQTGLGAMLLAANFVIANTTGGYFDAPAETNPLLNTWSLSVEEQFYLVFPAVLALGWFLARRLRAMTSTFLLVSMIAVGSFFLAWKGFELVDLAAQQGLTWLPANTLVGFYSPFTRAWEFAAGAMLALVIGRSGIPNYWVLKPAGPIGFLLLIASFWLIDESTRFPGPWALVPVTGTLCLLVAGRRTIAPTTRLLSGRLLVSLGDWSYSIYLWHWPLIVFTGLLWPNSVVALCLALAATIAVSVASYTWIEQPIRSLQSLHRGQWAALVTATMLPPLLISLGVLGATQQGWWLNEVKDMRVATETRHLGFQNGCHTGTPLGQEDLTCRWNTAAAGAPIYLVGDSNAEHLSEGILEAALQINRPLKISTAFGCPFADLDQPDDEVCVRYVNESIGYLTDPTTPTGTVVISNSGQYFPVADTIDGDLSEGAPSGATDQIGTFQEQVSETIQTLQIAGHEVLLVQPTPHWAEVTWTPIRCSVLALLLDHCEAVQPLQDVHAAQANIRSAFQQISSETRVPLWDPTSALCPDGLCSTQGPGYQRYQDSVHISVQQSRALAPLIRRVLE